MSVVSARIHAIERVSESEVKCAHVEVLNVWCH
jgi:hypothetical protein